MYSILPLFKSHYSQGKSILTLEKPSGKENSYPISIFDLLIKNNLKTLVLVDDCISGLLQASKIAEENKIKLIYGLRLNVSEDLNQKDEPSLLKRAKYIIFAKNSNAYESLIKIWSTSSKDGFYYEPNIDFKTLREIWNNDLIMCVPFYDSFLYLNTFCSHIHVPDLEGFGKINFLVEDNNLPFDYPLSIRVRDYVSKNTSFSILPAQSIFYKNEDDYLAYLAFRCLHNHGFTRKCTLERPELDHMSSDKFNFEKWLNHINIEPFQKTPSIL